MPNRDSRKRHRTGHRGVFWRGSDKSRRYEVAWRCHGTCGDHTESGQHWERAHGSYEDAIKLRNQKVHQVEQLRARKDRGERIAPKRTFAQVTDEYRQSRAYERLAPGTRRKYDDVLDWRILPVFGDRWIDEMGTDDIASFLDDMRNCERTVGRRGGRTRGFSESTINGALTSLRVVFRFAASRSKGYIGRNPCDRLDEHELPSPEEDKREIQVLDELELGRLYAAAPESYRLMLELAGGAGLRSSELRGLVWGDADLDRQRIKVSRQIDTDDRGDRVALKDRALTESRYVPLTDALTGRLLDHRARRAEYDLSGPGDFLFGDGRHVKHDVFDQAFRKGVNDAGIDRHPAKRLSPHSLRHGYGSLLLAHGEQLSNVSAWLGHRKISTTEKWYAHQIESLLDVAAERMRERERERLTERTVA
jgi:integrase